MGLYNGVVGNAANMLNGMGIFMTVVNTVGLPLLKDIRSVVAPDHLHLIDAEGLLRTLRPGGGLPYDQGPHAT